jgi:hypothetical protein
MSSKSPPVPKANLSPKGPGDTPVQQQAEMETGRQVPGNLDTQGRQGNIHQNTTHQGLQQDR